jgi:steroid delta-isomerase-like uncharacterized protein
MTQETRNTMQRLFDEFVNGRNLDSIDELVTPDFVEHEETPGLTPGRDGVKQLFAMLGEAFPDFRMNVEDMIAEGDKGVVRSMFTGTHKGEWMGIPATGRSVSVTIFDMFRVSGGKIVEHWGLLDSGAMMEQLGVAPQV